jgi:hypothetical protein
MIKFGGGGKVIGRVARMGEKEFTGEVSVENCKGKKPLGRHFIIIIIIYLVSLSANGFLPRDSGTTIRQHTKVHISHNITHHAQTKLSTQSYANNKEHIIHNGG